MTDIILYDYSTTKKGDSILSLEQADKIEEYAQIVWDNRVKMLHNEDKPVSTEQQIIKFDRKGNITTNKYVGIIKHDDVKIEIHPKIIKYRDVNWGLNLLFWLSYSSRINIPFHKMDIKNHECDDILEILALLFAKYAHNTISTQPYYSFTAENCESSFLKGQLNFEKQISNIASGRWHKFHISHKPLIFDNLLNRIIKFVVRKLISVCSLAKDDLSQLIFILDEVTDVNSCSLDDCDKVGLNPLYEEYYSLIDLCRMFIENLTVTYDNGNDNNYSFILPINLIFEDFILGFISKHLPIYEAQGQKRGWLATNNGVNVFQTRNDIFLRKYNVIIDTKYKVRVRDIDSVNKGGVGHNDMYQMLSYAISGGCDRLMLLYPHAIGYYNDPVKFKIANKFFHSPEIEINICSIDICIDFSRPIESCIEALENKFEKILSEYSDRI